MTSCSRETPQPQQPYDPVANGLNTYALACQLASEGHEGVRRWFESEPEKSA